MACDSGVDDRVGACRRGGGRLCGCNDTSGNGYIIISRHRCDRPYVSGTTGGAGGSGAWVGQKIGGGVSHHVGGCRDDLVAFTRIETYGTGVSDVYTTTMCPAVYTRRLRGDG
jgi:hypothetical protein